MTRPKNTENFKNFLNFISNSNKGLFLKTGLNISSCKRPKGHTHPHANLPNVSPNKRKKPVMYKRGVIKFFKKITLRLARAFCKIPIGHEKRLVGQEWQLSPGTQNPFKGPVYRLFLKKPTKYPLYKIKDKN